MPSLRNILSKIFPLEGIGGFLFLFLLTSCYRDSSTINEQEEAHDALAIGDTLTQEQQDSISFYSTHHYTEGYNFQVRADSLPIMSCVFSFIVVSSVVSFCVVLFRFNAQPPLAGHLV